MSSLIACVPWDDASVVSVLVDDEDDEHDRTPSRSCSRLQIVTFHRYIRVLACVRTGLCNAGENDSRDRTVEAACRDRTESHSELY